MPYPIPASFARGFAAFAKLKLVSDMLVGRNLAFHDVLTLPQTKPKQCITSLANKHTIDV